MRLVVLMGLTGLMLASGVVLSRAEDAPVPMPPTPEAANAMPAPAEDAATPVSTGSILPQAEPMAAPAAKPSRYPSCPAGRTVGTGAGFCLIN